MSYFNLTKENGFLRLLLRKSNKLKIQVDEYNKEKLEQFAQQPFSPEWEKTLLTYRKRCLKSKDDMGAYMPMPVILECKNCKDITQCTLPLMSTIDVHEWKCNKCGGSSIIIGRWHVNDDKVLVLKSW